jgi:hypothetical protein
MHRALKKLTYHVWTIREIKELKLFAEKGLSTKQAADRLNVPHFSVKNACYKYRIKFIRRKVFKKGMRPWNKGLSYSVGQATQYKKGHVPHNTKHDGAIRIQMDKCGISYKHIRVSLGKWVPLHRYVWTQVYGDPGTNVIRFKDGNTMNCDIDNLKMVNRADNMRLNTLTRKPKVKERLIAY